MLEVPGIVFDPYDDELINFLEEKLRGEELEPEVQRGIKELDVYGEKEPWLLFDEENFQQNFYVFTRLRMNKSVFKRTVGGGTWVMQKTEDVVDCHGNRLGFKKLLIFVQGKKKKKKNNASDSSSRAAANGHWIMHELSSATHHPEDGSYVICRIRNKDLDSTTKAASSSRRSEENRPPKRPRIGEVDAPKMLGSAAYDDQNSGSLYYDGYTDHAYEPQQPLARICDLDAPKMSESTANSDQNSVSLYRRGYTDDAYSGLTPISDTDLSQDHNYTHNFYFHPEAACDSSNALAFDIPNPITSNVLQQGVAATVCPSGLVRKPETLMHDSRWEFLADDQRTEASFTESLRMAEEEMEESLEKLLREHNNGHSVPSCQ